MSVLFGLAGPMPVARATGPTASVVVNAWNANTSTGAVSYNVDVAGGGCSGESCQLTLTGWYVSGATQVQQKQLGNWSLGGGTAYTNTLTANGVVLPEITDLRLLLTGTGGAVRADSGFVHVHDLYGAAPNVSVEVDGWSQNRATGQVLYDLTLRWSGLGGYGGPCGQGACNVNLRGYYRKGATSQLQKDFGSFFQSAGSAGTWSGSARVSSTTPVTMRQITDLWVSVDNGTTCPTSVAPCNVGWTTVAETDWSQFTEAVVSYWRAGSTAGTVDYSMRLLAGGLAAVGNVCETASCSYSVEAGILATGQHLKTIATGSLSTGSWYVDNNLSFTGMAMPAGVDALHIIFSSSNGRFLDRWMLISSALQSPTPTSVSLTVSPGYVSAGEQAILTATANENVWPSGSAIKIVDLSTDAVVASCSAGTICSAAQTAGASPHFYQAAIGTSSPYAAGSNVVSVPTRFEPPAYLGTVPLTPDVGDPVNAATGNFHDTVTDLVFAAGSGLPAFTRTYNSQDTHSGVLGTGWSMSFQSSVSVDVVGNALLRAEDGKTLRFIPKSGGGYTSPPGYDGTLTHQGEGSWQLTGNHGGTIGFASTGRLTGMTNPDGTVVTLSYAGSQLTAVSSSTGAGLSFAYDAGSGRLTGVSSSDGRSVSFGYSSGRLTAATDVAGESTTYRYDTTGLLDKITDPDGRTKVVNSFDGLGRVTSQLTAQGQTLSYDYSDDATRSTTVVESGSGASTSYAFDDRARLLSVTDTTGHSLSRSYDSNGYVAGVTTRLTVSVNRVSDAAGNVTSRVLPGGTEQYSYDSSNRLISSTDVLNHTTSYGYTGTARIPSTITHPDQSQTQQTVLNGLITARTDADGVTTTFGYDSARNLTSTQVETQPATTMTYDGAGRLLTRTSPGGRTTTWTYDPAGRVLTVTDPAGAVTTHSYDGAGHLTSTTDALQHTTSYVYDGAGQLTQTHAADGTVTSYSYDDRGQLLTETRPGGAVTTNSYGPLGRLVSVTDPMGRVTSYGYDADGQVTSTTTEDGTSTSAYDPAGELITSTNPANQATTYTRDALGRVTAVTDPTGAVTRTHYDSLGRVDSTTDALSQVTGYSYTPAGRLETISYPDGHERSYDYDSLGQRVGDTDPGGELTTTSYTADGQVDTVTSPGGLVTDYGYDPAGRVSTLSRPGTGTVTTTYTLTGQVATRTDATGALVQFSYDVLDRLATATDPLGKVTSYGYDVRGNRTSVTDPLGHSWTSTFNLADEPTGRTDPLGHASTISYDPMGRVLASTDASGVSATNTYDTAGNLTRVTFGDGTHTDYTYDPAGRRLSATTAAGTETFTYDAAGRLLSDTLGSGAGARTVSYGYDVLGRVASITYPDGRSSTRSYDPNGNLLSAGHTGGGLASYSYDPDGHVLTATAGSGTGQRSRAYTWTAGQLSGYTETAGATSSTSTLGHDPAGRLTSLSTGAASTTTYGYDVAGQLLSVTGPTGTESYSYDPVGNLSTATVGGVSTSYSYDHANQLTSTGGATSYSYDLAGRLLSSTGPTGSTSNSYDAQGRLAAASTTAANTSTSRARAYTPAGELGSITSTTNTQLLPGFPATVSTSTTALTWDRTHSIPQPLVLTSGGADSNLILGPGDDLAFASTPSTPAAVFSHNALGDLLPTTDTAALVQGSSSFSAYGQPSGTSNSVGFGYRSQLHTGGQLYLHHRTLDPALGRFTSRDPLDGTPGQTVATNPYPYAGNDPVNQVDPSGLSPNISDGAIQAGFAPAGVPVALAASCARPVNKWHAEVCLTAELALQGAAAVAVGTAVGCTADVLIYGSFCGLGGSTSQSTQTPTVTEPEPTPSPGTGTGGPLPGPIVLYHYTSADGLGGILTCQCINSATGDRNARYGDGAYFTDLSPGSLNGTTAGQLSYALYGVPWNARKVTHYVAVDVSRMPIPPMWVRSLYGSTFVGGIYLVPSPGIAVSIAGKIVGSGRAY